MGEYADGRITCTVEDDIALVGLNDPEHLNAISMPMVFGLHQAVSDRLASGVRQFVFYGNGSSFSSGAHMDDYLKSLDRIPTREGFEEFYESEQKLIDLCRVLRRPDVFSVAAVHGWVVGIGFELCLACDFLVADDKTTFWMPETRAGWNAGMGAAHMLSRVVGTMWARRMLLLNEKVPAKTAERIGLLTRISSKYSHVQHARELLAELKQSSPRALQYQKRLVDILPALSLDDSREIEVLTGFWLAHTHDVREAARAFLEKREPRFLGH